MFYGDYNEFGPRYTLCHKDYEIQRYFGNFGIIRFKKLHEDDETAPLLNWVVAPDYDSIFRLGWGDIFVLSKNGRVGAVRCVDDTYEWVAPCEYYAVNEYGKYSDDTGVAVFFKRDEKRCYFHRTHAVRNFSGIDFHGPNDRYMFAVGQNHYYIIDSCYDTVLWESAIDDPQLSPYRFLGEAPCLVYMGTVGDLPMFLDIANGNRIVPVGENKLGFMPDFPNVIIPIIVKGKNIINITDDIDGKIYAGSFEECIQGFAESEGFDEAAVELKVTLKNEAGIEERCYPIPYGTFHPGDVVDFVEWFRDIEP